MRRVLIVVDMLNGFCHPDGALYAGEKARAIIPFVGGKIKEYNKDGSEVIFLADSHHEGDPEFKRFPPHCLKGSWEAQLVDELKDKAGNEKIIEKTRFSGMYNTPLAAELKHAKPDLIEVVGVCTNICVLYTVESLRNRDYTVRVHKQGVASFDDEAHEFALKQMDTVLGAEVV